MHLREAADAVVQQGMRTHVGIGLPQDQIGGAFVVEVGEVARR